MINKNKIEELYNDICLIHPLNISLNNFGYNLISFSIKEQYLHPFITYYDDKEIFKKFIKGEF